MKEHRRLLTILILGNLGAALTGFFKDLITAAYLGTSSYADAFTNAYFIVDTIALNILAFSIWIGSASTFGTSVRQNSTISHRSTVRIGLLYTLLVTLILVSLLYAFQPYLIHLFSPSYQVEQVMGNVYLALLPMAFAYPIYTFLSGVFQASELYTATMLAPIWLNLSVVVSVFLLLKYRVTQSQGAVGIAIGYSFGSFLIMFLLLAIWTRREKRQFTNLQWNEVCTNYAPDRVQFGVKVAAGYAGYLALQQIVGFAERYLAFKLGPGSVAALSYAYRISQVPSWVVISAVMVMVLPNISFVLEQGDRQKTTDILSRAVTLSFYVCLPISIMLIAWAFPIVVLLFQHGNFNVNSSKITATFLTTYACAITSQATAMILFRTVVATGKIYRLMIAAVSATACTVAFDVILLPRLGPSTLGLGSCLWGVLASVFLWQYLYRSERIYHLLPKEEIARLLFVNTLVACVCFYLRKLWFSPRTVWLEWPLIWHLALGVICVAVVYMGSIKLIARLCNSNHWRGEFEK